MKIAVGSDHRGFALKQRLREYLIGAGHDVTDLGATSSESVDYPDFAASVCHQVADGQVERGLLICGSGIGMAISANKHVGIRAVRAVDELDAEMGRRHNNVNVLCLSSDRIGQGPAENIVDVWIATDFEGGRHARRIEKIGVIEREQRSE